MNEGFVLINSAIRAEQYETWEHPSVAEMEDMAKGGFIKIGVESLNSTIPSERFWVRVSNHQLQKQNCDGNG